jgi:hypothetical protein
LLVGAPSAVLSPPLSLVKNTTVLSATPASSSAARTSPTAASIVSTMPA